MRSWLRSVFFKLLRRALLSDDGRDILRDAWRGNAAVSLAGHEALRHTPYADLGCSDEAATAGEGCIFITGRFRSGSTLLWNVFRSLPGCTAYYEPLNERRWFDPVARGSHTDQSHRQVHDYWSEYDGLLELSQHYREEWIRRDLFMSERSWDPGLQRYIEILIQRASGRPVLQFNRVDFRLPWLRAMFPLAKIVHLYRHPRDQWLSTLHGGPHFRLNGKASEFGPHDKFYLLAWCRDLAQHFPFLDVRAADHPYELFYLVWKLSFLFGRKYADESLSFESLVESPQEELSQLLERLKIEAPCDENVLRLIERPQLGRWTEYASHDWFAERESRCERILTQFFAANQQPHVACAV